MQKAYINHKTNKEEKDVRRNGELASKMSTADAIRNNKTRLQKIREEILEIRKKGLVKNDNQIMKYYINPFYGAKLGSVLECVKLYVENLERLGFSQEDIMRILNNGSTVRACLNDNYKLEERIKLFDECKVLAEVMENYSSLLAASFENKDLREFIEINEKEVNPLKLAHAIRDNRGYVPKRKID